MPSSPCAAPGLAVVPGHELPPPPAPRLVVQGLCKSYGAHRVLSGVSFTLEPGRILGVVGENGAGKSTLVKCLMGLVAPDGGVIERGGCRIAAVYQEFNLANDLTVAANVFLGREPQRGPFLDKAAMRAGARRQLARLHKDIDPDAEVGRLSIFEKQTVEIAKALEGDCNVLIMDEPSTLLSKEETQTLFAVMRGFVAGGRASIIYISHKLDEVREICDDIAVLRDGVLVSNAPAGELDAFELARRMVGRELTQMFPPKIPAAAALGRPVALELRHVASGNKVADVSFTLHAGEIMGLAGIAGAGRSEVAEAVCGLRRLDGGEVRLFGEAVAFASPAAALAAGVSYLSEDRKETGVWLDLSCAENVALPGIRGYAPRGFLDKKKMAAVTAEYFARFKVNAPGVEAPLSALSGGNQQKIAIAKGLDSHPRVFIFDEPTRGVDVAARRDIYDFIHGLALQGVACLMICSDLEELIGMCDRVAVLRAGRTVGELTGEQVTENEIMYLAAGAKEGTAPA